jgi:hypothetical protein
MYYLQTSVVLAWLWPGATGFDLALAWPGLSLGLLVCFVSLEYKIIHTVENPGISYSELHFLIPDSRAVFDLIFTLSHITHH